MKYYGVWAVRSENSDLGHAEAWHKNNGVIKVFTNLEFAKQQAELCNKSTRSPNISYYAKEMNFELIQSVLKQQEQDSLKQQNMIKDASSKNKKNKKLHSEQNPPLEEEFNQYPEVSSAEIPTLRKFISDDIIGDLESIMKINTKHYHINFKYDRNAIMQAAQSERAEDKNLLWLSHFSGTHCFRGATRS